MLTLVFLLSVFVFPMKSAEKIEPSAGGFRTRNEASLDSTALVLKEQEKAAAAELEAKREREQAERERVLREQEAALIAKAQQVEESMKAKEREQKAAAGAAEGARASEMASSDNNLGSVMVQDALNSITSLVQRTPEQVLPSARVPCYLQCVSEYLSCAGRARRCARLLRLPANSQHRFPKSWRSPASALFS